MFLKVWAPLGPGVGLRAFGLGFADLGLGFGLLRQGFNVFGQRFKVSGPPGLESSCAGLNPFEASWARCGLALEGQMNEIRSSRRQRETDERSAISQTSPEKHQSLPNNFPNSLRHQGKVSKRNPTLHQLLVGGSPSDPSAVSTRLQGLERAIHDTTPLSPAPS